MASPSLSPSNNSDDAYRTIEDALLESARGRWFLSEHGRRARRLDSALLEDAIGRLQSSLRQPPALLGQLQAELQSVKAELAETRASLMSKPTAVAAAHGQSAADPLQPHAILKAAEDIHDIAWALQANPFDPQGCETIARNAGKLYALSQTHAVESDRALSVAAAIDKLAGRLDDILATVINELQIDTGPAA